MSWQSVKLEEIFDIARGGSPRPIADFITDEPDGLNWISIKDASNSDKYITKTKLKIRKEGLNKSRLVKDGDFLLTNSMSFGRPYIMKTTGCIHDGWLVLTGNKERINQDYFYHLLGSDLLHKKFSKLAAGAVVKNLNIDLVKSVEILLPPLVEQQKIATILDIADSLKQKSQQLINHYTALSESLFLDMFGDPVTNQRGWDTLPFENMVQDHSGGNTKIPKSKFLANGLFPIVDQGKKLIAGYTNKKKLLVKARPPYIIFGDHTRVFKYIDIDFAMGADGIKVLKPKSSNSMHVRWLFQFLLALNIPDTGYNRHFKYLKEVKIQQPPIMLQNQFVDRIVIIEEQMQQVQLSLEKTETLFNSLLQRAFNGELTGTKAA